MKRYSYWDIFLFLAIYTLYRINGQSNILIVKNWGKNILALFSNIWEGIITSLNTGKIKLLLYKSEMVYVVIFWFSLLLRFDKDARNQNLDTMLHWIKILIDVKSKIHVRQIKSPKLLPKLTFLADMFLTPCPRRLLNMQ